MGNIQSKLMKSFGDLFSVFKGRQNTSLAILGLDNAGKSTLVNLFRGRDAQTVPTLGFNMEEVVICDTSIRIWDVGGQREFISYWSEYVREINGLVFVIDIADNDRFNASYEGFRSLAPYLQDGMPILLLLNKADLIDSADVINERQAMVKKIYNIAEQHSNADLFIKLDEKHFKNRLMVVSVVNDLKAAAGSSSKSIQESTVFPGFKWLIDEMKSGSSMSHNKF